MIDVFQGAWVLHHINKDEGNESLPLLAFRRHVINEIFLKYSKKGGLLSHKMFVMITQNNTTYNLNTGVLRTPSII